MVVWKQQVKRVVFLRKDFQTSHELIRGSFTLALENVANEPWLFYAQPPELSLAEVF